MRFKCTRCGRIGEVPDRAVYVFCADGDTPAQKGSFAQRVATGGRLIDASKVLECLRTPGGHVVYQLAVPTLITLAELRA